MQKPQMSLLSAFAALSTVAALAQDVTEHTWTTGNEPAGLLVTRPAAVHNSNRASRIVDMRVLNSQNQDLGRVEDVVFDLQTGRIAYVVLALPGAFGSRLVAVPPSALSNMAGDSNTLVLNIDPVRLDRSTTFSRDNWPDLDRPFAGNERLWGMSTDRYDPNRVVPYQPYRSDSFASDQGASPRYEASSSTERFIPPPPPTERPLDVRRSSFRGKVIAVNPETRALSVESSTGEIHDFIIGDRPNIQLKNNRNPRIVDIKVGYPIVVGYREEPDGTSIAQTIIRTDAPEVR